MKSPLDLIKEIGAEEKKLTSGAIEFISPVFKNRVVVTSVKGIIYKFIIPEVDSGWYMFKGINRKRAKIVREAYPEEIDSYTKKLPSIRLVTTHKDGNVYFCIPQKNNALNIDSETIFPVFLPDDVVMDFEMVVGKWDGGNIWYDSMDFKNDPVKADYLRESFEKMESPDNIKHSGLTFEEKKAYAFRFAIDKEVKKKLKKQGVEDAVTHAGGDMVSYRELKECFSVTYTVDGERYTSHVSKDPGHNVITAGICLNGTDSNFDLASLVDVIRTGQNRGLIYRTGV